MRKTVFDLLGMTDLDASNLPDGPAAPVDDLDHGTFFSMVGNISNNIKSMGESAYVNVVAPQIKTLYEKLKESNLLKSVESSRGEWGKTDFFRSHLGGGEKKSRNMILENDAD